MEVRPQGTPYSLVERRTFLARLGGILGAGFLGQVLLPLWRYVFPGGFREPDHVELAADLLSQLNALEPGHCLTFRWGGLPGLLLRGRDGEFRAFKGVCTHADCNVTWRPENSDFFCACHEGFYDEFGRNVAGPPPRPLPQLVVILDRGPGRRIVRARVWRDESARRAEGRHA